MSTDKEINQIIDLFSNIEEEYIVTTEELEQALKKVRENDKVD